MIKPRRTRRNTKIGIWWIVKYEIFRYKNRIIDEF